MTTPPPLEASENSRKYWQRVLRPLFWWLLLVLALFAHHQHQLAMERTRLNYSVAMQGRDVGFMADVKLDGQPASSGQRISLGEHTLTISLPKARIFTTNFFGWYGGRNFGQINLQRAAGALIVTATPAAQWITITGPEFSCKLWRSTGTNVTVPEDRYEIRAKYPHWEQTQNTTVYDQQPATCSFLPRFGALHLTGNREETMYQIVSAGQAISSGDLPVTVTDLPADRIRSLLPITVVSCNDPSW